MTHAQRLAILSGEDAPETKSRYEVIIGDSIYMIEAYDAYHAERIARGRYRIENRLRITARTPIAEARLIGQPSMLRAIL